MNKIISCLSGKLPATGILNAKLVDGAVVVDIVEFEDFDYLVKINHCNIAHTEDGQLLVIDDYYD